MTFLFPVFGQFVPISWSEQSSTSFQVGFLIFCRHLFMPVTLLLLLLLLLWDSCSWQWWWWCGFFSFLVIWLCNNSCKLLLYLIQLVGWQSPNWDSLAMHLLWANLNNSVYYFVWPAVVLYWTVQLFTAGGWSGYIWCKRFLYSLPILFWWRLLLLDAIDSRNYVQPKASKGRACTSLVLVSGSMFCNAEGPNVRPHFCQRDLSNF